MHRRVDGVQTPRHRADDGVASMAYSTQEVTDRWKTGDITWYGDYIDDKSCGTGKYGLPEKEVDENDSGELSGNQPVRRVHPTILHEVLSRRLRGRAGFVEPLRNRHRHAIERTSRNI